MLEALERLLKRFSCSSKHDDGNKNALPNENDDVGPAPLFHDCDIRKDYQVKGLVGFPGSFGEVRAAISLHTGKTVAVKSMKRHKHTETLIKNEIDIMRSVSHENISKVIAVYENKKMVYIVMEKYDGGDLFDLVVSNGGKFGEEAKAAAIIKQILHGLIYLHSNHIVHCDIKLCNIMLASSPHGCSRGGKVKIIDFGVSQRFQENELLSREVGSPSFIAPEVIMGAYTQACDVWSLGCVVFILLFGFNPFNPKAIPALANKEKICEKVLRGFTPEVRNGGGAWFPKAIPVSAEARDFIAGMLVADWKHRLTAQEALEHPWIVKNTN